MQNAMNWMEKVAAAKHKESAASKFSIHDISEPRPGAFRVEVSSKANGHYVVRLYQDGTHQVTPQYGQPVVLRGLDGNDTAELKKIKAAVAKFAKQRGGAAQNGSRSRRARRNPDHSTHPVVVEYAVRSLFKGKSPAAAAKLTSKNLGGFTNYFVASGSETLEIDPKTLENAVWNRIADLAISNLSLVRQGKEDFAVGMAADHFRLKAADEAKLTKIVVAKLGRPLSVNG